MTTPIASKVRTLSLETKLQRHAASCMHQWARQDLQLHSGQYADFSSYRTLTSCWVYITFGHQMRTLKPDSIQATTQSSTLTGNPTHLQRSSTRTFPELARGLPEETLHQQGPAGVKTLLGAVATTSLATSEVRALPKTSNNCQWLELVRLDID